MKIWFSHCLNYYTEEGPKLMLGLNWYKHYHGHPYKGFTVQFIFLKWLIQMDWVNDYKKYDFVVNQLRGRKPHWSKL
jgi:hypothetical protein